MRQIHPQADAAAAASRCAGEQGKFWQFHDRLFESNLPLSQPSYLEHATQLGLDATQFSECVLSDRFVALIEAGLAGRKSGGSERDPGVSSSTVSP